MSQITGTISRWQGVGLMATTLLGTGVFILPQITIEIADNGALFSWCLLTLAIIPITIVFSKLAASYPHAAGPAYFVEQAFGNIAGRCIGLSFLMLIPIGSSAAILITFEFLSVLLSVTGIYVLLAQLGFVALILAINLKGIQVSAKLQFLLTLMIIAVTLVLLILCGIATPQLKLSEIVSSAEFDSVLNAAGIALWSFLGIEAMTHLSADFRNPEKDMVPAMLISTVLVGLVYIACTYMLITIPTQGDLAMVDAFDHLIGDYGALVIGILGVISGLAVVNVYCAGVSRLIWSFSGESILPKYFYQLNQHQVPVRALIANLSMVALAICFSYVTEQDIEQLISWTNGVFVIIYSASMFAAAKLLSRSYLPLVAVSCLFCLGVAYSLGNSMIYAFIILLVLIPSLILQRRYLSAG